ncbi:MAG TPA: transporter [Planctomycetota bacterium]|nr:transporter [Planctomycetota bacterium]
MNRSHAPMWGVLLLAFPLSWACSGTLQAQTPPPPSQDLRKDAGPKPGAKEDAEEDFWNRVSLEGGLQLDTGKFGGKAMSAFLSLPVTLGYDHDGVIASVSVPYVVQRSRGNVIRVGGRVVRVGGTAQRRPKTVGGLGDILVDAGYYVIDTQDEHPYLLLDGEIKIPTADDERALGTGSADETIRATTGATFFNHLKVTADLAYQFIGQPEDILSSVTDYHNTINVGGGVGYKFTSANTLWAKFDGSTAIVSHTPPYELVYFEWDHTFKNDSRLLFSVGFGLTKSSPGLSLELSYLIWF